MLCRPSRWTKVMTTSALCWKQFFRARLDCDAVLLSSYIQYAEESAFKGLSIAQTAETSHCGHHDQ